MYQVLSGMSIKCEDHKLPKVLLGAVPVVTGFMLSVTALPFIPSHHAGHKHTGKQGTQLPGHSAQLSSCAPSTNTGQSLPSSEKVKGF